MNGFIALFANHRIAPNLLMVLMIISGFFVVSRFETRFFPAFDIQIVLVKTAWQGVSAEDVDASLLTPLENELRNVADLKTMRSYAYDGLGVVQLEFPEHIDTDEAAEEVRRYLDLAIDKLPAGSDPPETQVVEEEDEVLRLSLTGDHPAELRRLARRLEAELLQLGDIRVDVLGLPKETLEIRLHRRRLAELNLTPADIGQQISAQNVDVTAGDIDSASATRLLRALAKGETANDLADLSILDGGGNFVRLGDIATITRTNARDEQTIFYNGKPAAQFNLTRQAGGNALSAGKQVRTWITQRQTTLPPGFELIPHKEEWQTIQSRLSLLVKNGLQGLALVLCLLFLFLSFHVALWVAVGIPTVFMVSLCVLYLLGGSIDMITMFAFIMTTGIVVDDAIVVSENALYRSEQGEPPMQAAVNGAREMFAAIFSSTLTTLASFMPLIIVGGPIGSILFVIPLVVVCVLVSALVECFYVLPGHLAHAFSKMRRDRGNHPVRDAVDGAFLRFQEQVYRPLLTLALRNRLITIVAAHVLLVLALSLMLGGYVKYRFFPGAEVGRVQVRAEFVAGTSRETVEHYMRQLLADLEATVAEFPEQELLQHVSLYLGKDRDEESEIYVEMVSSEQRQTSALQLAKAWREKAKPAAGLDNLTIREEVGGPPGEDLEIQLSGGDAETLKTASLELQTLLRDIPGVSAPKDDMPYGKKQTIFELTSLGRSLNLSVNEVAARLRDAFDGYAVQTFYQGVDEVEVRVLLDGDDALEDLAAFRFALPGGGTANLSDIVNIRGRRGFDTIQRVNSEPIVNVVGDIDFGVTNANRVISQLEANVLPPLIEKYGLRYSFEGSRADEVETLADMKTGLQIALFLIFIVLAAVFASWTMPAVIILTAPLGFVGAIFGHAIMGYELSILSMFGIFTLNGIVINDSIVLVRDYMARQEAANDVDESDADSDALIIDSACRRLRAIVLTSLTTIGGLSPLMFESSTQAQFLIPMAVAICFGLAFATLLILFLMPVYLSLHHSVQLTAVFRGVSK